MSLLRVLLVLSLAVSVFAGCVRESSEVPEPTSGRLCWKTPSGDPIPFERVSLGRDHGCGLDSEGKVACWGAREYRWGEPIPSRLPFHGAFSRVDSGAFTCALATSGEIVCGEGSFSPPAGTFRDLAVSQFAVCGIDLAGAISCAGAPDSRAPDLTDPPAGSYVSLTLSDFHGCALDGAGGVKCWGAGEPDDDDEFPNARQASPPTGRFEKVVAGSAFTCGLTSLETIECWGEGFTSCSSAECVMHEAPSGNYIDLDVEAFTVCALRAAGEIVCFGYGDAIPPGDVPPSPFASVHAGDGFACGRRTTGELECWGRGESGFPCTTDVVECGQAIPPRALVETCAEVSLPPFSPRLVAGAYHTCLLRSDERIRCWGRGETAEPRCGDSDCEGTDSCVPILECGQAQPPESERFIDLALGIDRSCGLRRDGSVVCWGVSAESGAPAPAPEGAFASLAAGLPICGIRPDGEIACWGESRHGESRPPPRKAKLATAGYELACALDPMGEVFCWGLIAPDVLLPRGPFVALKAGDDFACALRTDGALACFRLWPPDGGDVPRLTDRYAAFDVGKGFVCAVRGGDGSIECASSSARARPELVPPSGSFLSVALGAHHACGLGTGGSVACWGENPHGEIDVPDGLSAF